MPGAEDEQLHVALGRLGRSYEVIYVDDGSTDRSFERLRAAAEADPRVRVIRFRRNFGQTAALQAGIEHSRGDILVFMPGMAEINATIGALILLFILRLIRGGGRWGMGWGRRW